MAVQVRGAQTWSLQSLSAKQPPPTAGEGQCRFLLSGFRFPSLHRDFSRRVLGFDLTVRRPRIELLFRGGHGFGHRLSFATSRSLIGSIFCPLERGGQGLGLLRDCGSDRLVYSTSAAQRACSAERATAASVMARASRTAASSVRAAAACDSRSRLASLSSPAAVA